jgi:sulfite exporter TauE/SafE
MAACARQGVIHSRDALAYFMGRLGGYTFLGAIFGTLGMHLQHRVLFGAAQRGLWFAVAGFALVKGLQLLFPRLRRPLPSWTSRLVQLVQSGSQWIPRRGLSMGLVTSILPCGMLAAGWALAASTATPWGGSLLMAVFCVATSPALVATLLLIGSTRKIVPRIGPVIQGALWCALAVWIGIRPLFEHAHVHLP